MNNIEQVIKKLSEQVNIKAISTVDLVKELEILYSSVSKLNKSNDSLQRQLDILSKTNGELTREIVPTKNLQKKEKEFEQELKEFGKLKFKFDVEKEYIERENNRMNEILKALLSTRNISYNDHGNNSSMNYSEVPIMPNLKDLSNRNTKKENNNNN